MKQQYKKIEKIPEHLQKIIEEKSSEIYLEQLRVKEYSKRIPLQDGQRKIFLPFSGGLDSTAALLMAIESGVSVSTVNINYGQSYYQKEAKAIKKIKKTIVENYPTPKELWATHYEIDISWLNRQLTRKFDGDWKHIFPFRNYLILVETAKLAKEFRCSEIWFGCVKGEIPYSGGDKSTIFLTEMAKLLSVQNILLVTPHIGSDKADILNWGLLDQSRYEVLIRTVSCFSGQNDTPCGQCQSCFNRGVAFYINHKIPDLGYAPQKSNLHDFITYYKSQFSKTNYYPVSRINQINKFISFLESND